MKHNSHGSVATKDKLFKELDEETVFACMINWIIHKMQQEATTKVRFRTANKIYQVILQYNGKKLRVKDLEVIAENDDEFVLYDWGAETNFDNLTTEKMQQGMDCADNRNKQRHDQVIEVDEVMEELFDIPVEITAEDMEMINEFLNV